ncbi:hypothetical protein bthur0010_59640 [Bacillus thuringiensis serovar pondicheriensis BGSC 4BA1]|nr:hypothetical protein bthur0010_59640 [Bacillus thuringiensis serovar pondicheriensis BGSC 4BA1]
MIFAQLGYEIYLNRDFSRNSWEFYALAHEQKSLDEFELSQF